MTKSRQAWLDQLVVDEEITDTGNLKKEKVLEWYSEYNETFDSDIGIDSFKRMLRKARFKNNQDLTPPKKVYVETIQSDVGNVLVVGDLHLPFTREGYLEFCIAMYKKHKCKTVIFIGDIVDNHYSSYHETDPDSDHSAKGELDRVKQEIKKWYEAFPEAYVCEGNHDLIPQRKMFTAGLSSQWLKPMAEVLDTPNWKFSQEFIFDGVTYLHGTGRKARQRMKQDLISIVQGHYHSESYTDFLVGRTYRLFAMQVGCGINRESYAFAYGKAFARPHINVGIVKDQGKLPVIEYMQLGEEK